MIDTMELQQLGRYEEAWGRLGDPHKPCGVLGRGFMPNLRASRTLDWVQKWSADLHPAMFQPNDRRSPHPQRSLETLGAYKP